MKIEELLKTIGILAGQIQSQGRASDGFNVFKLCGVDHYETAHSKILAEFLNPHGTHGAGEEYLVRFFEALGIDLEVPVSTEISTEEAFDDGRLDILIQNNHPGREWAVVIENKIYAGEQPSQIPRYWNWLKKKGWGDDRIYVVFLTLDGHESETAKALPIDVSRTRVKCASYKEHVAGWLNACIGISAENPFVRESLRQYRNLINDLVCESKEDGLMEKIKDICVTNHETFYAAMCVAQAADSIRAEVAKRIITRAMEVARYERPDLSLSISDDLVVKYAGFGFACPDSPFDAWFEFQSGGCRGLFSGLGWKESVRNDKSLLKELKAKAEQRGWRVNDAWANGQYLNSYKDWDDRVLSGALMGIERYDDGGLIGALKNRMMELLEQARNF